MEKPRMTTPPDATSPDRDHADGATTEPFIVTRQKVTAAKFHVVADRRLGRETPDWIVRLSQAKRVSPEASAGPGRHA